jgi:hypothetical protein
MKTSIGIIIARHAGAIGRQAQWAHEEAEMKKEVLIFTLPVVRAYD